MAVVASNQPIKNDVSVTEQMLIINYIIAQIKASGLFDDLPIELNFLSSSNDALCLRLNNESAKVHEYVDGSYEAQIMFTLIYRKQNISSTTERVNTLDRLNKLCSLLENLESVEIVDELVYINKVSQQSQVGILFRDQSGVEDNGATFVVSYDKN